MFSVFPSSVSHKSCTVGAVEYSIKRDLEQRDNSETTFLIVTDMIYDYNRDVSWV